MVNIGYHAAKIQGKFLRSVYKSSLSNLVSFPIKQNRQVPIKVYALSCERDLPEQVASLRSFCIMLVFLIHLQSCLMEVIPLKV